MNYYSNSSYISGPFKEDSNLFIASQGPLKIGIENFWKLLINKKVKLVIMLTNLQEHGRKKCDQYWPDGSPIIFEKLTISMEHEFYVVDNSILQRSFLVYNEETKKSENITQLHVLCWPDHSIPEDETGYKTIELLLSYIDDFRSCYDASPVIVHCR